MGICIQGDVPPDCGNLFENTMGFLDNIFNSYEGKLFIFALICLAAFVVIVVAILDFIKRVRRGKKLYAEMETGILLTTLLISASILDQFDLRAGVRIGVFIVITLAFHGTAVLFSPGETGGKAHDRA